MGGDLDYPRFVHYSKENEYREHFCGKYCSRPVDTFDGLKVRFRKDQFEHCFFESSNRDGVKDRFSSLRAERMDWIQATLQNPNAELFVGWDKRRKRNDKHSRVAVVMGNYVVIIRRTGIGKANFVTAFVADTQSSIDAIKSSPKWIVGSWK